MTRFRNAKLFLKKILLPPAWPEDAASVPAGAASVRGMEAVGPLLALLPHGGLLGWRAVIVLGRVVADMAETDMGTARNVMRRCMWHMNEDSGNMGWGIAEAMGEILAKSPVLAGEYGRVVLSYVRDTGFADNFVDHGALRRGAYWAVGRFAPEYPVYRGEAFELLGKGLDDEDRQCRGMAAWGLEKLVLGGYRPGGGALDALAVRLEAMSPCPVLCELLDGVRVCSAEADELFRRVLREVAAPGGGGKRSSARSDAR